MAIIILLIPLALLFLGLALWALFWAINRGQFEDLEHQAWRVCVRGPATVIELMLPQLSARRAAGGGRRRTLRGHVRRHRHRPHLHRARRPA